MMRHCDARELFSEDQPLGVDIVHHQREFADVGEAEQVAQELTSELGAAGPYKADCRHAGSISRPQQMSKFAHRE